MRGLAVAVVAALAAGGCGDHLRFVRDDRLRFLTPPPRSFVRPPFELTWRMSAGGPAPAAFGVFVDRPPMRPGEDVRALVRNDPFCRPQAGCPDRAWLRRNGVVLTKRRRVVLDALPAQGGRVVGRRRLHEITVVLLDGRGRRLGESAWTLRLFAPRGVA